MSHSKNVISLHCTEPWFFSRYILCLDEQEKYFVIVETHGSHDRIRRENSIPIRQVTGGGEVSFKLDAKQIQFGGYSGSFGEADHVKAVEVAKEDILAYIKENMPPEYHLFEVVALISK